MNLGIFGGRLGKDADINTMSNGDPVCNFSLAVDIGTRDNPKTMWVECAVFGKRAESLHPYLTKGTKVTCSGRVSLDEYTSRQTGEKKTALRMTITEIDMHLPPRDRGSDGSSTYERPAPAARRPAPATKARAGDFDDMHDDIPF